MIDLLKSLIDRDSQPRRSVEAGMTVIAAGEPASLIFCLENGQAVAGGGLTYDAGDLLLICEALALDEYSTPVSATKPCRLVAIRQDVLEAGLKGGGKLVRPLSRSIASDITRRRLAGRDGK